MNILFYLWRYPAYGGIEKVTTILANYFAERLEWNVSIVSHYGEYEDDLLPELSSRVNLSIMPHGKNPEDPDNTIFLQQVMALSRPDVLIFQDCYFNAVPLFQINKDIPIIAVEHNTPDCYLKALSFEHHTHPINNLHDFVVFKMLYPYRWAKLYLKTKRRHRLIYRISDAYVMLSSRFFGTFKRIAMMYNTPKLNAIYNPLTVQTELVNLDIKEKICVFVSRLVSEKGIGNLLKIWQLVEQADKEWKLVIVGDGPERITLEGFISKHRLLRVNLVGYQKDVKPWLRRASIYLMASVFEGWGLTLVEAMSMGCIPMAFDSYASVYDIIDNGSNGYLIKPFNTKKYAQKLLELFKNSDLRQVMAIAAQKKSQEFNIENICTQWVQHIEKVIQNHKTIDR